MISEIIELIAKIGSLLGLSRESLTYLDIVNYIENKKSNTVVSNIKNEDELNFANQIFNELKSLGKEVIIDDRKERFGFKIKDFELIGFPYALIVGKSFNDGKIELIRRENLEKTILDVDEALEYLKEII
jgi:prolyl-tRNA synthetase